MLGTVCELVRHAVADGPIESDASVRNLQLELQLARIRGSEAGSGSCKKGFRLFTKRTLNS